MKRILCLLLSILFLCGLTACGRSASPTDLDIDTEPVAEEPPKTVCVNPFTGVEDLPIAKANARPVAIMINNIRIAQAVQTGVAAADIVYETEVEGGITRLLAVYKDVTAARQLGAVRSARYPYIDLALGMDAVYVHCGIDPTYAKPHVASSGVEDFDINTGRWSAYGFREANGLSLEHTMYTSGEKIAQGIAELSIRDTTDKNTPFAQFHETVTAPADRNAYTVTVPFSTVATSVFTYDAAAHLYRKDTKGTPNKDYKTGAAYRVTNVFVLQTAITDYPDGYHRKVALTGGNGYYISEGGYVPITWKKNGETSPLQFFAADGSPLVINPGKSWVCLQNANYAPVFEPDPTLAQETESIESAAQ